VTSPTWLRRIRPAEWLTVGGLAALAVVAAWTPEAARRVRLSADALPFHPNAVVVLAVLTAYLVQLIVVAARKSAATVALALAGGEVAPREDLSFAEEGRILVAAGRTLRDCFPLYAALLLYQGSDFLVWRLRGSATADAALIRWDQALFGGQASVWLERFVTPARTDLFSVFYFLHLVVTMGVLVLLHFVAPRRLFAEGMQGFVTMMMVGLVLYVLVPAVGPKYMLASSYTRTLEGGALTDVNATLMDAMRASRDVFPSLHVALSGMVLIYAWRARRWLGLIVLPLVLGNWVSTVYLRYHYLVDLLAAWVLIPIVYFGVHRWMDRFDSPPAASP